MSIAQSLATWPPHRPAVVLLHSSAGSAGQWRGLIETLEPRFQVHAVDFHGHGARGEWRADAPLKLEDDAALVAPLLAQAGGAHLVGHSYGAAVALKLATLFPQSVRSVIGYEPVLFRLLFDDPASRQPAQGIVALAECVRDRLTRAQPVRAAQRFVEFWSGAGAWDALPPGPQRSVATRMSSVLLHFHALFHEPPACAALARLRMPMLLLAGAGTVTATRRIAQILRAALPLAHHEWLPDMGHLGPITHAPTVNRRIAEFLHFGVSAERAAGAPLVNGLHRSARAGVQPVVQIASSETNGTRLSSR